MSGSNVLSLSDDDLMKRRNSVNKQDLINAIIQLRKQNTQSNASDIVAKIDEKLNEKLQPFLDSIQKLTESTQKLHNDYAKLKAEIFTLKSANEEQFDKIVNEVENRRSRECNLIVSGISEPTSGTVPERKMQDLERVRHVIRALDGDPGDIITASRIGAPRQDRPRLIRLKCFNFETKIRILREARKLRDVPDFDGIYVIFDLTQFQQEEGKNEEWIK